MASINITYHMNNHKRVIPIRAVGKGPQDTLFCVYHLLYDLRLAVKLESLMTSNYINIISDLTTQ